MKDKRDTQTPDLFADSASDYSGWAGAVAGMNTATEHAEQQSPGWSERALLHVAAYVAEHPGKVFVTPDVRAYAEARGLDSLASNFAWGNVMREARKQGLISRVGYATSGTDVINTRPMSLWRARGERAEPGLAERVRDGSLTLESALAIAEHAGYVRGRLRRLASSGDPHD